MNTVLLNTIMYLKPKQIFYRVYRKVIKPRISQAVSYKQRKPAGRLKAFPIKNAASLLNNVSQSTDWNRADISKLALYQLHYFDFIHTLSKDDAIQLCYRWIDENPMGVGNGWEPYPISQRIINWVKWLIQNNEQDDKIITSLYLQARYLFKTIEYHLLGNHLFANAIALICAGLFFCDKESGQWLRKGEKLFLDELNEQILPDGGHFERAPMYHAKMFSDVLDLYNVLNVYDGAPSFLSCQRVSLAGIQAVTSIGRVKTGMPAKLACWHDIIRENKNIQKMQSFLSSMTFPDGEVAYFNDSVVGFYHNEATLKEYAKALGFVNEIPNEGAAYYPDTGFVRLQNHRAIVLMDVGSVGPSYIPGHAHAESLSFEMTLDGQRVFVNTGITTYEENKLRLQERSTAAHNCLVIDEENSSQVWKSFRVGKRAKIIERVVNLKDQSVTATHDGYNKIVHQRQWRLTENSLIIQDNITGHDEHLIELYFHFHPDVNVELVDEEVVIQFKDNTITMVLDVALSAEIIPTHYAKTFSHSMPNKSLKVSGKFLLPVMFTQTILWDKRQ